MASIFRSLDKSDIRVTPFRTYKQWDDLIIGNISGSVYKIYKAVYSPSTDYLLANNLLDSYDQSNPVLDNSPITVDGYKQRIVHKSIDHLYYRDFYTNNKASFGSGNINRQVRLLGSKATVIGMPQQKFGESIAPDTIVINTLRYLRPQSGVYSGSNLILTSSIVDDSFGNLIISQSITGDTTSLPTPYGLLNINTYPTLSLKPVYQWPINDLYRYVDATTVKITSSFDFGNWELQSRYSNIQVVKLTGSTAPYLQDLDYLDYSPHFSASTNSISELVGVIDDSYNQKYNFENGDFSISMLVRPTQKPTNASGSCLLAKHGYIEVPRIDLNGNPYTVPVPNKMPYKLSYTSGSCKLQFFRSDGINRFSLTSSISMSVNTLYHIVAMKSGSQAVLYVNSPLENTAGYAMSGSIVSASITVSDKTSRNDCNIYIGNNYLTNEGFNGTIDNLKIFKGVLTEFDINFLYQTVGKGDLQVGNAFYNHGMMILTSPTENTATGYIYNISTNGTHTIWETEYSCTVPAGTYNMSTNRTLQEYSPEYNDYIYRSFVTSSDFKPYVTTIGLYNDRGYLLAVGKLSTPIQMPSNMDTTFIVRYDK